MDFPLVAAGSQSALYVVVLPHVAQVRFWRPKCLIRKKDMPFGNPPHHGTKNCGLLKNIDFFHLFTFYRTKSGVLGQKRCFEYFGPGVR